MFATSTQRVVVAVFTGLFTMLALSQRPTFRVDLDEFLICMVASGDSMTAYAPLARILDSIDENHVEMGGWRMVEKLGKYYVIYKI